MMTKPFIKVENLYKKYSRNAQHHLSYGLGDFMRELSGRRRQALRKDEFFAVNDVSFELASGDSFALIGRNGSGKTTLLKMLNGLVKPDGGRITIAGRVQALINLGAGFSPRLSGMENIFSSASLMGLSRRETMELVDTIIDFSELDGFIDSPVGTYSAGMKARLGFSVAVHLKPDILLIDEILAVGDFAFQNKCYKRMQQLKKTGVTIVLVSHSQQKVLQMCERALWIHDGAMRQLGPAQETMKAYVTFLDELEAKRMERDQKTRTKLPAAVTVSPEKRTETAEKEPVAVRDTVYGPIYGNLGGVADLSVRVEDSAGRDTHSIRQHGNLCVRVSFRIVNSVLDLAVNFPIFRNDGLHIGTISSMNGELLKDRHEGKVSLEVQIPDFDVNPARYVFVMCIHDGKSYLFRDTIREILVTQGDNLTWGIKEFRYVFNVKSEEAELT